MNLERLERQLDNDEDLTDSEKLEIWNAALNDIGYKTRMDTDYHD